MMQFSEWITKKYVHWRGNATGNQKSITEFAGLFNASHQIVSEWMKPGGKVPRSKKYVDALIRVYGDEVYEILGLEKPSLPPVIQEFLDVCRKKNIDPASNEAIQILMEIANNHSKKFVDMTK